MLEIPGLSQEVIAENVRHALAEDIGPGDLTAALVPPGEVARAQVITKEDAVMCGAAWFTEAFRQVDPAIRVEWKTRDSDSVRAGQTLCQIEGLARGLLSAERTALNFLQTLSGTATAARRYVEAVKGTRAVILDTRKTLPGLRLAQKYAVRCGGAQNHRIGLYDGVLIKENHIAAAGSIAAAVQAAKASAPAGVFIEVEVENLEELREAIDAGPDRILIDDFKLEDMRQAVAENRGRTKLEISGGVTLATVRAFAETGVDYISSGDITKNVRVVDLSMRFT